MKEASYKSDDFTEYGCTCAHTAASYTFEKLENMHAAISYIDN